MFDFETETETVTTLGFVLELFASPFIIGRVGVLDRDPFAPSDLDTVRPFDPDTVGVVDLVPCVSLCVLDTAKLESVFKRFTDGCSYVTTTSASPLARGRFVPDNRGGGGGGGASGDVRSQSRHCISFCRT